MLGKSSCSHEMEDSQAIWAEPGAEAFGHAPNHWLHAALGWLKLAPSSSCRPHAAARAQFVHGHLRVGSARWRERKPKQSAPTRGRSTFPTVASRRSHFRRPRASSAPPSGRSRSASTAPAQRRASAPSLPLPTHWRSPDAPGRAGNTTHVCTRGP